MTDRRKEILNLIEQERLRQFNLPGSEWDIKNTPNDWVAIATHYLNAEIKRSGLKPDKQSYQENLIKAASVIIAALENIQSDENFR